MFSLRLRSDVEFRSITVRVPVDGLKLSFVDDTLLVVTIPDVD
jgi:hypothetical protein